MWRVCLWLGLVCAVDTILKPLLNTTGKDIAIILLQGASIPSQRYVPLSKEIQRHSSQRIWVSIPDTILDLQNPGTVSEVMNSAVKDLSQAGCVTDAIFVGGHSLGTIAAQEWARDNPSSAKGAIFLGGAIQRKWIDFPMPALTVGAELDGLYRITRVAEEFYRRQNQFDRFPVIVVPGMSHMQFASGPATPFVQLRDLLPEISFEEAWNHTGAVIASFVESIALGSSQAKEDIEREVELTRSIVQPIIDAYEFEGARWFNGRTQIGGPDEDCPRGLCFGEGSQWAVFAQKHLADMDLLKSEGFDLEVSSQYVELTSLPPFGDFHLPSVSADSQNPHLLKIPTYSQSYWDLSDSFDGGFTFTSASEIGSKLLSRQCIQIRGAGKKDTPFSVDQQDLCAQINQKAFEWALDRSSNHARERFNKLGQKFLFSPDSDTLGGPFWVYTRISYNSKTSNGEDVLEVVSPTLRTPIDYPKFPGLPDPSCYHYCKLLSPARAIEWIYVDSLRLRGGLSSSSQK